MSQPQYSGSGFNPGATPSAATYQDPTTAAPVADCQAAVDSALAYRDRAAGFLSVPNMSNPGTHAGTGGVDAGGVNEDS